MDDIVIPDIGDFQDVEVIEVLVEAGDSVEAEAGIITIETDKATMDVPTPVAGTIAELSVSVGDKVNEGDVIGKLDAGGGSANEVAEEKNQSAEAQAEPAPAKRAQEQAPTEAKPAPEPSSEGSSIQEITVPDIGDFQDVEVIEVLVEAGDSVEAEAGIITLETDKATMDVPSPVAGKVEKVLVKASDKVNQGDVIALLAVQQAAQEAPAAAPTAAPADPKPATPAPAKAAPAAAPAGSGGGGGKMIYASPAVRKLAREYGVDLSQVRGSAASGRIIKEDMQAYVRDMLSKGKGGSLDTGWHYDIPRHEKEDYASFGQVEKKDLERIRQLSGPMLHRNWLAVPHVTQFDDADVTELEKFRKAHAQEAKDKGFSLSPLAFLVKAVTVALHKYPEFNSSLARDGKSVFIKKYFNIGIAVDTPGGLVVPVLRNIDSKSVMQIAEEMGVISKKARENKLGPKDLAGGTFTISSLGGIGGTHFTPIVNAPEVAILGVGRTRTQPVWDGSAFAPRAMLPLALSYDHRVIDGAKGARFITHLSLLLSDIRNIVL